MSRQYACIPHLFIRFNSNLAFSYLSLLCPFIQDGTSLICLPFRREKRRIHPVKQIVIFIYFTLTEKPGVLFHHHRLQRFSMLLLLFFCVCLHRPDIVMNDRRTAIKRRCSLLTPSLSSGNRVPVCLCAPCTCTIIH
jgi:hypothetical protein